ncbi:hypothetical protein DRP44_03935 [candidate division TA06 bacterium]|uniref:Uncharacterized protein n=1 Tax=candidate division TA06 bacterium TaxID=2250710 RepID=A0A660SA73_UNCT6|nr:MAG: hypothetical protein DRP44_03935 [candidate division TA06 bacterium]
MNRLLYTGLFRSPVSWAKVNRRIAVAMSKLHPDFYIREQKGFLYDSTFPLPEELDSKRGTPEPPYDDLCFVYPPTYIKLRGKRKFAVLTVESTVLPDSWSDSLNKHIDTIFVPSAFCKNTLVESGVKRQIIIARFGVDRTIFKPEGYNRDNTFRFLFIGTPHYRKGVIELIRAFKSVFEGKRDISLYLKLTYKPAPGKLKPWEIPNIEALVKESNNIQIDYNRKNDNEIAELIASSDVIVQPSYSEGFGLSILEAMAMKKPVITTCWSGECEFVNRNNALIINSSSFKASDIQYGEKTNGARMRKPSVKHLAELLEYAYTNFPELEKLKNNAYLAATALTWDKTAETILKTIY